MTMHTYGLPAVVARRGMLRGRHMGTYPGRRTYDGLRGFGQGFDFTSMFSPSGTSSSSAISNVGNVVGAAVGVPGAGSIATGVASTIQSIFGGNPAIGKDAQRQAHIYSIYETAMTAPGSAASTDAVIELYAIANQTTDPVTNIIENNPQATRTYAQQALLMLSTQGWQNVNSFHPTFTGVPASGVVYGSDPTTGQAVIVGQRPISSGLSASGLFWPAVIVGGFLLLRGSRSSASATVHHTSSNPKRRRRKHNRSRSRRRARA